MIAFALLNAIYVGAISVLGPTVAKGAIGEDGWGLVLSGEAAGLFVMTLVMLRVPLRRPLTLGMLGAAAIGIPMSPMGVHPQLPALLASFVLAGAGAQLFAIAWNVTLQENIDPHMLARANSYDTLGSSIATPIGQLTYGPLGAALGNAKVLATSGVTFVAICLLTLSSRSVRQLPRRQ